LPARREPESLGDFFRTISSKRWLIGCFRFALQHPEIRFALETFNMLIILRHPLFCPAPHGAFPRPDP
jgi:hypothetical protein